MPVGVSRSGSTTSQAWERVDAEVVVLRFKLFQRCGEYVDVIDGFGNRGVRLPGRFGYELPLFELLSKLCWDNGVGFGWVWNPGRIVFDQLSLSLVWIWRLTWMSPFSWFWPWFCVFHIIYFIWLNTAASNNRILPLANYCKSEEILFKSDTKHELQVNSSNLCTEDKQICIKVSTSHIGRTLCFRYQC